MSSLLSRVDVWNIALDHLVENHLSSEMEDSAYARWLRRNEPPLRDAFLRKHAWNFSIVFRELAEDSTTPDFRWLYRYKIPDGVLRVLPPTYQGVRGGSPVKFEVAKGYIYCDVGTTLPVRLVERVYDYTEWDPLAIDAFALVLAIRMTIRFAMKSTLRDRLQNELKTVMFEATIIDAMEKTPEPVEQHDVVDARFS